MRHKIIVLIYLYLLFGTSISFSQFEQSDNIKEIKFDIFQLRNYNPGELNTDDVLKFLFPGYLYKTEYDFLELETYNVSCWKSPNSTTRYFNEPNNLDSPDDFPLKSNFTFVTNKLTFINSTGKYIFYFFNTNGDGSSSGRFNGGYIGLAIFKAENNYYSLKLFDPAIDYKEHWNFAPRPIDIIDLGKGNFGIVYDYIGEGMSMCEYTPINGYLVIYSEINGEIMNIYQDNNAKCIDPWEKIGTEWHSKIITIENSITNNYCDLKIIIDGYYDVTYHPVEMYNFGFNELDKEIKKGKSFNFKITRVLKFDSNIYKVNEQKIDIY